MPAWTDVTFGYALYLAALAWLLPRFARARTGALVAVAIAAVLAWGWPLPGTGAVSGAVNWVVLPSLALLGAYRASGTFFLRPSAALEDALLRIDAALLARSGVLAAFRAAGPAAHAAIEVLYLCVYAVVPLGAAVLLLAGRPEGLAGYWTTVFIAELACYAALPWLQSRPPRVLDGPGHPQARPVRGLNLLILRYGSIQANTLPSGHAAGAVAVALSVYSVLPTAGLVFLIVAAGITLATILGRYHYTLDSILGVLVALGAWVMVGA
jgi:hypothetical protein